MQELICRYLSGDKSTEKKIVDNFIAIAQAYCEGLNLQFIVDKDEAIQESVLLCFDKISRYDPSKGKAVRFFSTIILCCLRQYTRRLDVKYD